MVDKVYEGVYDADNMMQVSGIVSLRKQLSNLYDEVLPQSNRSKLFART